MSNNYIFRWFNFAKRYLHRCNHHTHKIVAVVLVNKSVVAVGWNNINKTHPKMFKYSEHKKTHAEVMALSKAKATNHDLSNAQLIVYGETKAGNKIYSKPCQYCQKIIQEYKIKEVIYSSHEGFDSYKDEP